MAGYPWEPKLEDVAERIYSRTVDETGVPRGTFTETTRPTAKQAFSTIRTAAENLEATVGPVPRKLASLARSTAAACAAARLELAFFPDAATHTDRTAKTLYDHLLDECRAGYEQLSTLIPQHEQETGTGAPAFATARMVDHRERFIERAEPEAT